MMAFAMRYAELEITTNFTFLNGGSHPEELVATARALGLEAIAVTDRNTLAGIVRAHLAAKEVGIKFIVGVGPLLSVRQARFMNDNLFGVSIPPAIMARLEAAGGSPEKAGWLDFEAVSVELNGEV